MIYNLTFSEEAENDILSAYEWYEQQKLVWEMNSKWLSKMLLYLFN
jgi:hypothetical protein